MEPIYLDNASTSFPKPPQVAQAMFDYVTGCGCNIGRGGYEGAYQAEETVLPPVPLAGQPMRGVHQEHHREPERPAEGPAAARGPCAGVRHGAQRRHASPDPIDPPGRHLRPDPLPPGRHADDGAPSRPAAGEHPGCGDAPRQQRLRHPASGGGGGGLLPGKRPAVPAGHRPDRRSLPHRHGGHRGGRPGLHRPQGADGSPGHRGLPAAAGAGRGAGAAAVRRHRQRRTGSRPGP